MFFLGHTFRYCRCLLFPVTQGSFFFFNLVVVGSVFIRLSFVYGLFGILWCFCFFVRFSLLCLFSVSDVEYYYFLSLFCLLFFLFHSFVLFYGLFYILIRFCSFVYCPLLFILVICCLVLYYDLCYLLFSFILRYYFCFLILSAFSHRLSSPLFHSLLLSSFLSSTVCQFPFFLVFFLPLILFVITSAFYYHRHFPIYYLHLPSILFLCLPSSTEPSESISIFFLPFIISLILFATTSAF